MKVRPDRDSPVPLYQQIVESVRYRIATGQLRPGDALPPVRIAAKQWKVNLHTVRRAYGELANAGLAIVRRPQGATVAATASSPTGPCVSGLADFIAETVRTARKRFGVDARGLADLFTRASDVHGNGASARATFVECSTLQAEDYARQIERRWNVRITVACLEAGGEPPPGPILATYFHFNDVRRRWPHRHADMRFVAVTLDPALEETLAKQAGRSRPSPVILAETSADRARDALADLMSLLPRERFSITAKVTKRPAELLEGKGLSGSILFAPRIWSRLGEKGRSHPAAAQLRYVIEPSALSALGDELRWAPVRKEKSRAG